MGMATECAGRLEQTAFGIDAENDHVARVLVGGQQVATAGIEGEVPRRLAKRGLVAQAAKFARFRIDGKDGDAVVTAVRAVKKAARRMDLDLCRRALAGEIAGQRGECSAPIPGFRGSSRSETR